MQISLYGVLSAESMHRLTGELQAVSLSLIDVEGSLTSAPDRGGEIYPYIPIRWIARSRFGSIHKVSGIAMPKLFLHAAGDEVIPLAHSRRLFDAAREPKTFVELEGGHGDAFDADSTRYFGSIASFLDRLATRSQ